MAIQRRLVEAVEVTESRVHVIRLKGIFDASTVNEFEKVVSYLSARNFYEVVVDLSHVEFVSSAGWGAFTAELRRMRQNQGDVKLTNMRPDVYDVFLLLELDSFIQSFETVDEALAAFLQHVVTREPEAVRSSILQEIRAASHSREMAKADARVVAERHVSDFVERSREYVVAGQETRAAADAAPTSEDAASVGTPGASKRVDERIEHTADNTAPAKGDESFGGQSDYVGDEYADQGEYESSAAESDDESVAAEQAEYADDDYAGESEYESFSTESYDQSGAAEQVEYAGEDYAGESEYESSSAESSDEYSAAEQVEYAGDDYASDSEYASSSVESYDEYGAVEEAEDAGGSSASEIDYGTPSVDSAGRSVVEAQNDYAIAGEDGGSGSDHLTPAAASDPEMWELILASGKAPVDPYMFKKTARMLPEGEKPQEPLASGATKTFSGQPGEEDSLSGADGEFSAPDTSWDAGNDLDESAESAPSRNSEHAEKSHSAFPEKTGFEHAQVKPARDDEFGEFETQDICDPWILDEIDTFPEEYEMEGGTADGEEPSFSASKLLFDDLELETPFSQSPEQALERDKATQEIAAALGQQTPFEIRLRDRAGDTDASLRDSLTADLDEEARGMLLQDDLQGDFLAPSLTGEDLVTPGDDPFDPPAKSEKKRTARIKKRKHKAKNAKPDRSIEVEALIAPPAKPVAPFQAGAADSDDNWPALEDFEEARSETAFAGSVEAPAFRQENDSAENLFAPPALDENGELIARASELSSHHGNDEATHNLPPDGALPKIPASANLEEIVCAVVATHPDFGPAMICKFIEDRFEPPVCISRSTVYRLLRETGLNTREKRQEYADQLLDPSVLTEGI